MSLGVKIAKLRKMNDWTQDQFAEMVGVHSRHVSRWETDRTRPTIKRLQKISEVLGLPIEELLSENGGKTDSKYPIEFNELKDEEKEIITKLIHALATKRRIEKLLHAEE